MARFSKDRGAQSISIGPAIASTSPKENAGTTPAHNGSPTGGNGSGIGAGDEFVYIPGRGQAFQYPLSVTWGFTISGGTLTAISIRLQGSNDLSTWRDVDTSTNIAGEERSVTNIAFKAWRLNIFTFTPNAGTPIITGTITI